MKFFLNQRGMSLTSVLVALGLTGVLSSVIMSNMSLQNKSQKTVEIQANITEMKRIIQDFAGRAEPCYSSFAGVRRGEKVNQLKLTRDVKDAPFAEVGKEFQRSKLTIKEMRFLSLKEQVGKSNDAKLDAGIGWAYLRFTLEKIDKGPQGAKGSFGGQHISFEIPVVARFANALIGEGADKEEANEGWLDKFELEKKKLDAEILAQGIDPSGYPLVSEDNEFPSLPPNPLNERFGTYLNEGVSGGKVYVSWFVHHVNHPIHKCGNHLSTEK
jgi:hypothetical protein